MYDEMLFIVDEAKATKVDRKSLSDLQLQERSHLQEWILANPEIIGPGVQIVTSEFDRWESAEGAKISDRLDILAVDPGGRLVVVELKRDVAPHTIHMQAINYAAMVSRLSVDDVADLYARTRIEQGTAPDVESALTVLQTEMLLTVDGIRRPRIVLVASDFPPAVTAAVVWLNEQGVDMSLLRYRTYLVGTQTAVSFSRLYPIPDVEEFTIGRRSEQAMDAELGTETAWTATDLNRLAAQANEATLAMLDLCSSEDGGPVGVKDVAVAAGITEGAVRGQLAGLTMRLKNPKYGFARANWPAKVSWSPSGFASYTMDPGLAVAWRAIRGDSIGGQSETRTPALDDLTPAHCKDGTSE